MEDIKDKIQDLVSGRLGEEEKNRVIEAIGNDDSLKLYWESLKIAEAAIENDIAEDHRNYLKGISEIDLNPKHHSFKIINWVGIAASFLILITVGITTNLKLRDGSLADQYSNHSISVRSALSNEDIVFNQAQKAYRDENYDEVLSLLDSLNLQGSLIEKDKEWLMTITYLKQVGSKSTQFQNNLNNILKEPDHPYFEDANKLNRELHSFWRFFVVK